MVRLFLSICILAALSACSDQASDGATLVASSTGYSGEYSRFIGCSDHSVEKQVSFTWPGSRLEFQFEGSNAAISMASDSRVRFEIEVDGKARDLWVDGDSKLYTLASELKYGVHNVSITRITESFAIVSAFTSDPVVDGNLLVPGEAPERRLLVLGDSITAGYGIEGDSGNCHYSMETSNQQLAYAALAAEALNADLHAIAWSGIGAYRSYGEKTPVAPNIQIRSERTLADDPASQWDATLYQPDAVVIAIGTNDYWRNTASEQYRANMLKLLVQVTADYPDRPIYLIASPMLYGEVRAAQIEVLQSLAEANIVFADIGRIEPADGFGCDYHPNTITQKRMAKALTKRLETDLGW